MFTSAVSFAEPPSSLPVQVHAPEQDSTWKRYTEVDGITIFLREKEGSNIKEVIGKGVVDAPPCRVFQVFKDSDRLVEFMPYLEARIVKRATADAEYICEYLDFPWPIWDRFVNLRVGEVRNDHKNQCEYLVHWRKDETHSCTFEEVKEAYQDANPHAIVPLSINGYWHLLPQDAGQKTLLYYYGFTDPGGKIPSWLNNSFVDNAILKLFRTVRKRASQSDLYPPCQCSSTTSP
jgi:hypothetical protein